MMNPMPVAPIKPLISFEVLDQLDVRVGTIERVEEVAGSNKLLKLTVDFGDHKRSILAGDEAGARAPARDRREAGALRRQPRAEKMLGEISEGMLFDIGYADGILPALAVPERPVPNGARAG